MDKLYEIISGLTGSIPLFGWLGYVHTTRPSRKECEAKHKATDTQFKALCGKLQIIMDNQKEMHDILMKHVVKD